MLEPAIPANEKQRVGALHDLEILDTPPEERFDRYTRLLRRLMKVPIALVSLVDEERQWFKSSQGLDATETPRDVSFCGHAILGGDDILVIEDASADVRFADNPLVVGDPSIRFYAGCPLKASGYNVGTLCLIDSEPREFGHEDLDVLREFSELVAAEMASMLQATTDELTKLSNRRGFTKLAKQSIAAQTRAAQPISLVMIDMDGFKAINDTFGHAEGDRALVDFAGLLLENFRDCDVVARLGGDEFCVLMANSCESASQVSLDRLQKAVEGHNVQADRGYALAYSAGVVASTEADRLGLDELLKAADEVMYAVKRARQHLQ